MMLPAKPESLDQALVLGQPIDNYFVCTICKMVVNEPLECSVCQTAFCNSCL